MGIARGILWAFLAAACFTATTSLDAQTASSISPAATPPPATKLEAFKPAAGTLTTLGYNEFVGGPGISVDAREFRTASGSAVRGLVVGVKESQYREERAFVDLDEIPELLRGIDAILDVKTNPTSFENFEVKYSTRGELRITAFNASSGGIQYSVEAGRVIKAQSFVTEDVIRNLRISFAKALEALNAAKAK